MKTITPQADLLAYYGDRLVYIEDDTHKTCIVDYRTVLSLALKTEPYKTFWSVCHKEHLVLLRKQKRTLAERELKYQKANALGRALHSYYSKLNW